MNSVLASVCILGANIVVTNVTAQESHEPPTEFQDDPFVEVKRADSAVAAGAPTIVRRGPYVSVQVNVDSNGNNIPGDAANEPSIAINVTSPNQIAIGWRQFDTTASNFRQAGVGYSADGGATWTFPGVLEPGVFRSDPVLASDAQGNFYYNSLTTHSGFLCDVFVSSDGGMTWSKPLPAFGGDKAWMTVDQSPGAGRRLPGNIYCSWSTAAGCCSSRIFTRSTDGGQNWLKPITLPSVPIWGTLDVGADGSLFICGQSSGIFRVLRSDNASNSAVTPTFPLAVDVNLSGPIRIAAGPNPGGLLGQAWIETDFSVQGDNVVYLLCSVDPPGDDPLDVMFARSLDNGQTWSSPMRINDDPVDLLAWQWFGTMSVAPNGRIDVIFNDTRSASGGGGAVNISEMYYAWSFDAGATWSRNVVLTPQFDSHIGWPNQNKIGDYYHTISDDAAVNIAYAATFNGEQDVWFLRAGDCNNNGIHDGLDIADGTSSDNNNNAIPDDCEPQPCAQDIAPKGGNGQVDVDDLLAVINAWGPCPGKGKCPADIAPSKGGDGVVNVDDLLLVINAWGPCE